MTNLVLNTHRLNVLFSSLLKGVTSVVNDQTFEQDVLKSDVPVLVDFWAPWCGPCKLVAPELEKLAAQYDGKVDIVKVNVDENPALQQAFNIMSIPTIAYFKGAGAQPVGAVGFQTAEQLESRFSLKELA